jgi:hypothetical protein
VKGSGPPSTLRRVSLTPESDRSTIGPPDRADAAGATAGERGELDSLPVLAEQPIVVRAYSPAGALSRSDGMIPAVQAAAVAAGGFVAGAAVVGLAHRRSRRSAALGKGRGARRLGRRARRTGGSAPAASELIQIVGSRSLLVDVHLLGGR